MNDKNLVMDVIMENSRILRDARKWNDRAGANVFPVMSKTELMEWVLARIGSATSCGAIEKPESLRFPELDREKIAKIRRENPDTMSVLGRDVPVYYAGSNSTTSTVSPSVRLSSDLIHDRKWLELPDSGVLLPGGRAVEVVFEDGWRGVFARDVSIPKLKQKIADWLNAKKFATWSAGASISGVPRTIDENTTIPEVKTAVYGRCDYTGNELEAYGVVIRTYYGFEGKWYLTLAEANTARENTISNLDQRKREIQVESVRKSGYTLMREASDLYWKAVSNKKIKSTPAFNEALQELHNRAQGSLPYSAIEILEWENFTRAAMRTVQTFIDEASIPEPVKVPEAPKVTAASINDLASAWGAKRR